MIDHSPQPFLDLPYSCPEQVFANGFNPEFWRWGLTFNQGNGMSVSEDRVRDRLSRMAAQFLKQTYGNKYRKKARIRFIVFQHGSLQTSDQHFHALMGLIGEPHGMSDDAVAKALQAADQRTLKGFWYEKLVHVDCSWKEGNTFHSYVSRYVQASGRREANWFLL